MLIKTASQCLTPGSAHRVLQLAILSTPALLEKALARRVEQSQLRRHAERISGRLDQARGCSVKLALAHGCTFAAEPAGLFG